MLTTIPCFFCVTFFPGYESLRSSRNDRKLSSNALAFDRACSGHARRRGQRQPARTENGMRFAVFWLLKNYSKIILAKSYGSLSAKYIKIVYFYTKLSKFTR